MIRWPRILLLVCLACAPSSPDAEAAQNQTTLEISGMVQTDAIVDVKQNNPEFFDVNRPTQLPSYENEFGKDGRYYMSVRQTRFGVSSEVGGSFKTQFEFDLFGVGEDAGQTTIRLQHAWGQWKQIGAGQTDSQFTDPEVFPNVLDYWGPSGMLFFRNIQVFWRPFEDERRRFTVALEQPGASGDGGIYANRIELQNVQARFPAPDLTAEFRIGGERGYFRTSGALRRINFDDMLEDDFELSGHVTGWGLSFSSGVDVTTRDVVRVQYNYGHGIQNYFNDAPVDVGVKANPGSRVTPFVGEALPVHGLVLFLEHAWNDTWSSTAGYSRVDISNSDRQTGDAFRTGQYALANLLAEPSDNMTIGGEFQWARRANNFDGFAVNDFRMQFSFRYTFSFKPVS
jgi:hypothetical protein